MISSPCDFSQALARMKVRYADAPDSVGKETTNPTEDQDLDIRWAYLVSVCQLCQR
jgi:hypothetical protein